MGLDTRFIGQILCLTVNSYDINGLNMFDIFGRYIVLQSLKTCNMHLND